MPVVRTIRVREDRVRFSAARQFGQGPVVKWYNAAFALRRREFDSRQVHHIELAASLRSLFRKKVFFAFFDLACDFFFF